MKTPKVLCVCRNGNSRSVALAWLLKHKYHLDALAIGIRKNDHDTQDMLYRWADKIIVLDRRFLSEIPHEFAEKTMAFHVGRDIWFRGYDEKLIETLTQYAETTEIGSMRKQK